MEIIVVAIIFFGALAYNYFIDEKRNKAEKERFREFVIAAKSKDVNEYVQTIPVDEPIEEQKEEELVDLDQLDPETLLQIKYKELQK